MSESRARQPFAVRLPFALYPVAVIVLLGLHLWVASGVSPFAALRGIVASALIGTAASAAGTAIVRDRHRGGLVGLLLVSALVTGGRGAVVLVLLVPVALLIVERYGPRQLAVNWAWLGRLVTRGTAIFAVAVLLEAIQLGRVGDLLTVLQREGALRPSPSADAPADAPDVYVLMLDGYARADILQLRFATDDAPFLDGLRSRGFEVATESHSNYLVTNLSLPSFLNYRQLADVPDIQPLLADPGSTEGPPVYRAASNPSILGDFRALGYETVSVSSGFEQVAVRGADRFLDSGELNEFEIQMLRPTLVAPIATFIAADVFSQQHRRRIESVFRAVEGLAVEPEGRPRFVFAHVPSPHAPWVNGADGSPRVVTNLETWFADTPGTTGLSRDEVISGFAAQSAYLGRRTLAAIDAVLAASPRPPVILVLSDHGSSLDVSVDNAETRMRNLFAAYTPGRAGLYANDATLVNTFPTLLAAYFRVALPLAADTIYTQGPRGLFDPVPIAPTSSQR
jgi:hypothetical protein